MPEDRKARLRRQFMKNRQTLIREVEFIMGLGSTPTTRGRRLVVEGWKQVSRKYRTLARCPANDPRDILYDFEILESQQILLNEDGTPKSERGGRAYKNWIQQHREWVNALGESSCLSQYLRCHAETIHVDVDTFQAFRAAGGRAA